LDPNTMRAIDFWVGIPLCFVLTQIERVLRLFGLRRDAAGTPKHILFVQLAEMGTMVVAYPSLAKARELFPDATLHFLCFRQIRSSVEMLNILDRDNIITIDDRSLWSLLRDTCALPWRARAHRIDTVINMETFVRYSTLLSYFTGARTRVGFHRFNQEGLYTGDLVTHKVWYNPHIHAGHTFLDLVHALVSPASSIPRVKRPATMDALAVPKIVTSGETARALWAKLAQFNPQLVAGRKIVVLNPNASKRFPMRRLPLASYAELARHLIEDPEVFVLVTGVAEEKADAQEICHTVNSPRVIDLTGSTSMMELLHLFNLSHVLISNDSGPAHFACLTRVHVIVFFGPEIPDRYRPLAASSDVIYSRYTCSPCVGPYNQRLTPCNDNQCLKTISIPVVADLVKTRLQQAQHQPVIVPVAGVRVQ
jgi:ADP-heptose:LPS heptosyltransferase